MSNRKNIDFKNIINIFNLYGKAEAAKFVQEQYETNYVNIQRRIVREANYKFNRHTNKYEEITRDRMNIENNKIVTIDLGEFKKYGYKIHIKL